MLRLSLLTVLVASSTHAAAQPITIALAADVPQGAAIGIRGDTPPLAWDRSVGLNDVDGDGVYTVAITFPEGTGQVAYKAVITISESDLNWEPGENRLLFPGLMESDRRAFGGTQSELPAPTISSQQLARDLVILRSAIETLHPGLFLHNTEVEMSRAADQLTRDASGLVQEYGEAIPLPAVYLIVAKAVAAIRDGHTQVSMYNQQALTEALLYTRPDRVPFSFRLIGGRMIVSGDATPDAALPPGAEVLSLDGRTVSEIIDEMKPYSSADGSNDAKRVEQLQVTGVERVAERFDVIYSLLYSPQGNLALRVRLPDGSESEMEQPRMTQSARRDVLWARDETLPRMASDLLQYRMLDKQTAYLKVGSFATFSMDIDYDAWLTGAFRDMRAAGAAQLVVDLRGCSGGMDDAAAQLLRHIIQEPMVLEMWNSFSTYDVIPVDLREYVTSWSSDFYDLTDRVTRTEPGQYQFPTRAPIEVRPAPDAFSGHVAVLMDAAASSATFYLANHLKRTGAARLVGQVSGGSLKGLNAGQVAFLRLPNSGIVVDLPLFASRPVELGPDRGVIPDVLVAPDADAVIAGRDPDLEAALADLEDLNHAGDTDRRLGPFSFRDFEGEWAGTLTYTDYSDDETRVTLKITAKGEAISAGSPDEGIQLRVSYVEPDGSSGGLSTTRIANVPGFSDRIYYDGVQWQINSRSATPGGWRLVLVGEADDSNRPASVRRTLSFSDGELVDRKEVRYEGAGSFFERNTVRLQRAE